jgi:uncharacterized delta-60 repeat protein
MNKLQINKYPPAMKGMPEDRAYNGEVRAFREQPDGKVLVAGSFTDYDQKTRSYLVRLNTDGSTDNGFCLNIDGKINSSVYTVATQSDGKILVGGLFTSYGGAAGRDRLIRLNSDGTLDTTFCTNAVDSTKFSATVWAIDIQSDGKILVTGDFTSYAGTSNRNRLVRLNSDGTLDTTFCTNASDSNKFTSAAYTVKVQSDGKILVGGLFTSYSAVAGRSRLIRLNSDGTLDTTFCTNAVDSTKFSNTVWDIDIQSDGKILVCGVFTAYAGTTGRDRLIRLNSDGTLDTAFCINAVDSTKFSATVWAIDIQSDGKILVGGDYVNYAGTTNRNRLVRLNSDGTLDTTFCTNAVDGSKFSGVVYSALQLSNGNLLFGGNFFYTILTGASVGYLVSFTSALAFSPITLYSSRYSSGFSSGIVSTIAHQPDGKFLFGGTFSSYANTVLTNAGRLVRVNTNGSPDTSFCNNASAGVSAQFSATVEAVALQSDGKIVVGGAFINYQATDRNRLVRLNSDGTLDTAFCTNASDGAKVGTTGPVAITIQSDGKILVGGSFFNYAGTTGRSHLLRLNSDGTLDTTFCTNAVDGSKFSGVVNAITIQSDGKILVGGNFTVYAGTTGRHRLIRLNSDGTLDTAFCVEASDGGKISANGVRDIFVQSDGKILVCGVFTAYAGTTGRDRLIRLNSDGTLDTTFCTNAVDGSKFSTILYSVLEQEGGKILVGGDYVNYAGTTNRNRLVRLNSDGTLDTTFCQVVTDGAKFSSGVRRILRTNEGRAILGGQFLKYMSPVTRPKLQNMVTMLKRDGYAT